MTFINHKRLAAIFLGFFLALSNPLNSLAEIRNKPLHQYNTSGKQGSFPSFVFIDNIDCTQLPVANHNIGFCKTSKPKKWQQFEQDSIEEALQLIQQKNLGSFFSSCCLSRQIHLARFANAGLGSNIGFTLPGTHIIGITDHFWRGLSSHHRLTQKEEVAAAYVFHELVHLYDRNNDFMSLQDEFLNLANWDYETVNRYSINFSELPHWPISSSPKKIIRHSFYKNAEFRHRRKELYQISPLKEPQRRAMTERRFCDHFKIPSAYAVRSASEYFAELATMVLFDPNAKDYLPSEQIQWVLQNVFSNEL